MTQWSLKIYEKKSNTFVPRQPSEVLSLVSQSATFLPGPVSVSDKEDALHLHLVCEGRKFKDISRWISETDGFYGKSQTEKPDACSKNVFVWGGW